MSLLGKIIKLIILLLLMVSCSLSQSEDIVKNTDKNISNVNVVIPRLNPLVAKSIKESSSTRAYYTIDKLVLKIFDSNDLVIDTYTYDTHEYLYEDTICIPIILPIGDYKMEADIYNYKNSTTAPVVSGSSGLFTIHDSAKTSIYISMIPNNSEVISSGISTVVSAFEYTEYYEWGGTITTGSEHWYRFTANSDFITISEVNNTINYSGGLLPAIQSSMYKSNGEWVSSGVDSEGNRVFKTIIGHDYYLSVIPLAHNIGGILYKSNIIEFIINNYTDPNVSKLTAELIDLGYSEGMIFTGANDIDYYKVSLNAGSYIFESETCTLDQIIDSLGNIIEVKGTTNSASKHVLITTSGEYFLKLSNTLSVEDAKNYSFTFQEILSDSVINPFGSWTEGEFINRRKLFYKVSIDPTKWYSFKIDDSWYGTGNYTSATAVYIYSFKEDVSSGLIDYKYYLKAHYDDYYNHYAALDIPTDVSELIIEIKDYSTKFKGGSFAFKINEYTPNPTTVAIGTLKEVNKENGDYQYFSIAIDPSKTYEFYSTRDSSNSRGFFRLFTPDKSTIYHSGIIGGTIRVNPEPSYSEIIVKADMRNAIGISKFKIEEMVTP